MDETGSQLEKQAMDEVTRRLNHRRSRPLMYAISRLLITLSYAIVVGLIISLIGQAFSESGEAGVRSIAAAILPPLIVTYFVLFGRSSFRLPEKVSKAAFYIVSTIWIIAALILIDILRITWEYGFSIGTFILSMTLSVLVAMARRLPFAASLSCSFGIITGLLIYILIFGISN